MNFILDDTLIYEEVENEAIQSFKSVGLITRSKKWLSKKGKRFFRPGKLAGGTNQLPCQCQPCG